LRPTLGKKLLLVFAVLLLTAASHFFAIQTLLEQRRGGAALVNVTGSLRWLSQRIQLDLISLRHGEAEAHLRLLEERIVLLEQGGTAQDFAVRGLPEALRDEFAAVRWAAVDFMARARRLLSGEDRSTVREEQLARLLAGSDDLLQRADAIAAQLTQDAQQTEGDILHVLHRLALIDLTILVALWLAVRLRVVVPLRKLASASRRFARGRREVRSGFRSGDEIGQLALAFDAMADEIERDLGKLTAVAAELRNREEGLRKFSLAVEHSPVSVMITDAAGYIEYVNPKFTATTGYAPEETIGRRPNLLNSGKTPNAVFATMWQTLLLGREWRGELLNRKKNGELFWEDTRISPVKDEQGRVTHYVSVKEDVTARKYREESVGQLNAELERRVAERTRQLAQSNRELEAFSYSVSHDLRAPLRGINGFARLMEEHCGQCPKDESREYLARIRRASLRMGQLIDDLLELSRVTRSRIRPEPLDLGAMARTILEDRAVAEPGRRVDIAVQDGLQATGDATLLQAALENLLGNAWKFTERREPARIEFGCREAGGERVFFVRDNGAGFDMKYADKLFGAFQRLHGPQEFEGNGIGLAMTSRIMGLHGGRIWAESAPDAGATFYFRLGRQERTGEGRIAPK
jgi:PAS domain S-box-containing protein